MIDALEDFRPLWEGSAIHRRLGLRQGQYGVVTLHRPSNVDDTRTLQDLIDALQQVAREVPIIFPVHPRTMKRLATLNGSVAFLGLDAQSPTVTATGLSCVDPLGYPDFMALVAGARLVLTDSGGLQEETTALGVPCLTLRENTERPVTVTNGTNRIIGTSSVRIVEEAFQVLRNPRQAPARPPLWDGRAAERIVAILARHGSDIDDR
jgi:UDP-N-acetylglucosamine 2-epimerase (non-hydrolysing)